MNRCYEFTFDFVYFGYDKNKQTKTQRTSINTMVVAKSTFVLVLHTAFLLIRLQVPVHGVDICHEDQFHALMAQNVSYPWFHYIASSTDYDADFPSWANEAENASYVYISRVISYDIFKNYKPDIRALYGLIEDGMVPSTINAHKPSDIDGVPIDETSWDYVYDTILNELVGLGNLNTWAQHIQEKFLDLAKTQAISAITTVKNYISENNQHVLMLQPSSDGSGWTAAGEVFNSIADLFSIFGGEEVSTAVDFLSWAVTTTKSIGSNLVNNQNKGITFDSGISWNNGLFEAYGHLSSRIETVYTNDRAQIDSDVTSIKQNYGKLQKFWECYGLAYSLKIADFLGGDETSIATDIDTALSKMKPFQRITAWKLLLPAKYKFYAEYSCETYTTVEDDTCYCDNNNMADTIYPSCQYQNSAVTHDVRSMKLTVPGLEGKGLIMGWLGDISDHAVDGSMPSTVVHHFNSDLREVMGSSLWTLTHILDNSMVNAHVTSPNKHNFPSSFAVTASSTLQFRFSFELLGWCMYKCNGWGNSATSGSGCVSGNNGKQPSTGCNWCLYDNNNDKSTYSHYCGGLYYNPEGGSCLSSSTTVLMADNSYKSIADINVGDAVMNPLTATGQTVQAIGTPLRDHRSLFSINGLDFKFTRAHPFLLYNDSIAAVDKYYLLFYIPTYKEVQTMDTNSTLTVFVNETLFKPLSIDNIDIHDFDESVDSVNEKLYDLIFDFGAPSMYVINGGIVVSNEWYDFEAYPKSTYVLLQILTALISEENHTLNRLSRTVEESTDIIHHIRSLVDDRRSALNSIISIHATDVMEREFDLNETNATCAAFTLGEDAGNTDIFSIFDDNSWAVQKTMEELVARMLPQLNNIFHSRFMNPCFDDIDYALLVQDLVVDLNVSLQALEIYMTDNEIISATESTQEASTTMDTDEDDVAVMVKCFACLLIILHVLFS